MPPFARPLFWSITAPLIVGAVVFVLPHGRAAAVSIAPGVGVATAHAALLGMPRFPPGDAIAWLFWVALGASGAALLELAWRAPLWARLALRLALAGLLLLVLLWQPYFAHTWARSEGVTYLAGLGMITVASWTALGCCGDHISDRRHALLLTVLAGGAAAVLGVTGTASLALLAGALAASCAPAMVLGRQGRAPLASGGATAFTLVLTALLVEGHFYSDAPAPSVLLLAAAPLAALAGARVARGTNGWAGNALAIAPALLAIAAAVALAAAHSVAV